MYVRRTRQRAPLEPVSRSRFLAEDLFQALPHLFLLFALVSAVCVALATPPFMGPDEQNHMHRANLLTFGRLTGEQVRPGGGALTGGGPVDAGVIQAASVFDPLRFHPEMKVHPADFDAARRARWTGPPVAGGFQNTAVYGPVLYLPQSLALAAGKGLRLSVVDTLYLVRLVNGLACALIGFLALRLAGRARVAMFAVLLLPMSTFLYGTLTQDGMVIVTTALGCAVVSRAMAEARPMTARELWAAAGCFALVAMAKPPYVVFGLALLAVRYAGPGRRWAAACFPVVAGALWAACMACWVWTTDGVEARQAGYLLHHPLGVGPIALRTLAANADDYAVEFVGLLGWLDTQLPGLYLATALAMIAMAAWLSLASGRPSGWRRLAFAAPLVCLAATAGIFLTLYVQWTRFASPTVDGVQGRYFIPIALILCLALDGGATPGADRSTGRLTAAGLVLVAAFPVLSFWIVRHALVLRYFGP